MASALVRVGLLLGAQILEFRSEQLEGGICGKYEHGIEPYGIGRGRWILDAVIGMVVETTNLLGI